MSAKGDVIFKTENTGKHMDLLIMGLQDRIRVISTEEKALNPELMSRKKAANHRNR